jgi:hypothetical protein
VGDVNLDAVFDALLDVEGQWQTDEHDADEIVTLWLGLTHVHRVLGDLVKTVADDASSRLLDRDDPRADYETSYGDVVHLAPGYAPERWRGHDVIAELADDVIDTSTGERLQAVPVDVLVDVLPGCNAPDLTSSKWRTTGLRRHLADWHRYRSRDEAPLVIKRGPRPTKP